MHHLRRRHADHRLAKAARRPGAVEKCHDNILAAHELLNDGQANLAERDRYEIVIAWLWILARRSIQARHQRVAQAAAQPARK
jgi:hypothetical protein